MKTYALCNEIINYIPNDRIKVLNNGSRKYNLRRQRFTTLPPYNIYLVFLTISISILLNQPH